MSLDDDDAPLHGGPDALGEAVHDFSTNANACGPCPQALAAVQAADASRYPDPAYAALRGRLAAFHGVARDRIVIAASASEFIARATAAVAQRQARGRVQVPALAYGDYARAARAQGLAAGPEAAGPGTVLAWGCDPASPLGDTPRDLGARLGALPSGVPFVLDRAYAPLRLAGTPALDDGGLQRVWQLWSPNKALGLTGVRGAYAIAPADDDAARELLRALHRLAPSWPLGAHGVAMLRAWTDAGAQAWLAACLPVLRAWKASQLALCRRLGWAPLASDANFFCVRLPPGDMAAELHRLRAGGIKLRDCASFGLPGHVRLGVLPPASQAVLEQAAGAD